jgi:VWFA-related protein
MGRGRKPDGFFPIVAALSLFAILASGVSGGQKPSAQVKTKAAEAPLQHQVTVTLKLIQVFVTDAKGKSAFDLERSDFVLYDNGAPQTITDFEKHVLAAPAAEPAGVEAAPAPPPARDAAPLLSRKFIFFIDYGRNDLEGLGKSRKAAVEFLDTKVQKDDEVALFSFSTASGLTLHEYFTLDKEKVRAAIKKMRDAPGILESGMSEVSTDHEPMGMEVLDRQVLGRHGGHAGAGVRNLFAEVGEWAKALRSIPGQKNIVLFSRGFGGGVVRPGDAGNALFQTMARELASANAPVFSVNTTTGFAAKVAAGVFPEESLDYLSQTTGGKYLGGVDYPSRIAADIQDATSNYYVLGYTIPAVWDGKFHDVKVEVRRPGHKAYVQRGYFNPLPFNKLSPVEKHLHLLDLALAEKAASKRSLDIPLTAVAFSDEKNENTLLLSEIPVLSIREAVGDRTEFISLVLDQNKVIVDGNRFEIDWKSIRGEKVYQYAAVALAPGRYDCRVIIRNLDDGRAAVGSCSMEVAGPRAEGPTLFPPLFLVRGPEAQYLNVTTPAKGDPAAGVSISAIFPFPPKEYVPLVGPLERGQDLLGAVVRCVWKGNRSGEMELSAWLSPEGSGERTEVEMTIVNSASRDETDFYLMEFEVPGLLPGRYRLEIVAEDAATGLNLRTAGWFSVRPPGL